MMTDLERLASQDICYLTTTGRITGRPHRVEIWFALNGHTLYILHGEGGTGMGDWVKNMLRQPNVTVTIAGITFNGLSRLITEGDEDTLARQLLAQKYRHSEDDLVQWLRDALAVAVDLTV